MKKLFAIIVHPFATLHAPPRRELPFGDGWTALEIDEGVSVFTHRGRIVEAVGGISRCWGHATPRHHAEWQWEHVTN